MTSASKQITETPPLQEGTGAYHHQSPHLMFSFLYFPRGHLDQKWPVPLETLSSGLAS